MYKDKKIVVIITSVIKYADRSLSYTNIRSVFSKEERLNQTIKTIESVRKYIPNSKIVLLELGQPYPENKKIENIVDKYIDLSGDKLVRYFVDSKYKGFGEIFGILKGANSIGDHDFYIKISGRYFLTKNIPAVVFKKGLGFVEKEKTYSTRFYIVSANFYGKYIMILKFCLPFTIIRSVEKIFYIFIPKKWTYRLNDIGIEGQIAVDNYKIVE